MDPNYGTKKHFVAGDEVIYQRRICLFKVSFSNCPGQIWTYIKWLEANGDIWKEQIVYGDIFWRWKWPYTDLTLDSYIN